MNLAQYLNQAVTPLSEYTPPKVGRTRPPAQHELSGNRNRRNESLRRYGEVMRDGEWRTTAEITEAICKWNVEHSFRRIQDAFPTLDKWAKEGIVERRVKDDGEKWGRRARFEWRWKK